MTQKETSNLQAVDRKQMAILEEISVTSVALHLRCPLHSGASLSIDCSTCELRGKVVDCEKLDNGYWADVRLDDDSLWSKATFAPERLLNPKFLQCDNYNCTPDCDSPDCCGGSKADLEITI